MDKDLEGKVVQQMMGNMQDFADDAIKLLNRVGIPANKLFLPQSDIAILLSAAHKMQASRDIIMQLVGAAKL